MLRGMSSAEYTDWKAVENVVGELGWARADRRMAIVAAAARRGKITGRVIEKLLAMMGGMAYQQNEIDDEPDPELQREAALAIAKAFNHPELRGNG